MNYIRLGIAGVGNMGYGHLNNIKDGQCPRIEVTAVSDPDTDMLERAADLCPGIRTFTDTVTMLDSGLVDAVLIAAPHYEHPVIATECFKRKLHVITEKPAGVYTRQVREMNEAAAKSGAVFAIMFNQRTNPLFSKAREIVGSGALGQLKRLTWIITNWYRTQAYYDSGSWRGTWKGDGGKLVLEGGALKWTRLKTHEREFCFTCTTGFASPEIEYEEFRTPEPDGHPIILNNFADAILDGVPLIARGEEGINSLSISNAAYISTWTDDWSDIPVNEEFYEAKLKSLCMDESSNRSRSVNPASGKAPEPIEKLRERWQVRW